MSGFQRFVSYINLYEGNHKIRNVGFAKIEKQGGQCKIEIHLKGTGYTKIACPVYLFIRKEEKMEGISIGKIQVVNGTGMGNFLLQEEDISESGYEMSQIGGFLIFVNQQIMFASEWDDKEILREKFVVMERKQIFENPEIKKEMETEEEKIEEDTLPEELKAAEAVPQMKQKQPEEQKQMQRDKQKQPEEQKQMQWDKQKQSDKQDQLESEPSWEQKWQFILENYPVLTPFGGEKEILCVRMDLKDLRLLPKCYWYLGNNSFLLHGYFNYRYLILGAMEQEEKKKWFIGVPGIYQPQEKVMAAIFGFSEYKSEKEAEQKTGQFGYWYRFLND